MKVTSLVLIMHDGLIEKWFKKIAFDWTCQYGMNPGRALQMWFGLLVLCGAIYTVFIHFHSNRGDDRRPRRFRN